MKKRMKLYAFVGDLPSDEDFHLGRLNRTGSGLIEKGEKLRSNFYYKVSRLFMYKTYDYNYPWGGIKKKNVVFKLCSRGNIELRRLRGR